MDLFLYWIGYSDLQEYENGISIASKWLSDGSGSFSWEDGANNDFQQWCLNYPQLWQNSDRSLFKFFFYF